MTPSSAQNCGLETMSGVLKITAPSATARTEMEIKVGIRPRVERGISTDGSRQASSARENGLRETSAVIRPFGSDRGTHKSTSAGISAATATGGSATLH